jgi:ATP-dependent helicase/nuclease subunit B
VDVAGVRVLEGVLESWHRAQSLDPGEDPPMDPAGWLAALGEALDGVEIELATPDQNGVRVVDAGSALGVPRDHLFLVGMSAGAFPAEPPPRTLYTAAERRRLAGAGLPLETEDQWFDREAALFRTLLSTARTSLVASHAYASAEGQVQLPSAYFEELGERLAGDGAWCARVPGSRLVPPALSEVWSRDELWRFGARAWAMDAGREASRAAMAHLAGRDPAAVGHVLGMAAIERTRAAQEGPRPARVHAHNGQIRDPALLGVLSERFGDTVWSASRLESFGLCPWQFFARQVLRLESLEEPEDDVDAMTRGSLLHDCLEIIHQRLADAHDETALELDWLPEVESMLDGVLDEVVGRHAARGWLGTDELRLPRVRELRRTLLRYVRWEMEQNHSTHHNTPPRRKPLVCEQVFGMEGRPPVALTAGGRTLMLRGRIDRVDEIVGGPARGWRYVVDHKSGTGSLSRGRYDVGALLQLPLYLKVLEADGGAPVWGGAYHGMNDLSRAAPLHPYNRDGVRGATKTAQAAAERIERALPHALAHIDEILAGRFPAALPAAIVDEETGRESDPVKACPQYCDFRDVCRHYIAGEEGA